MVNKIIGPLDGSALSEKALPYATRLAKQLKVGFTLLRLEEAQPQAVTNSSLHIQEALLTSHQAQTNPLHLAALFNFSSSERNCWPCFNP